MSLVRCETCQKPFWREPSETWKKVCLPCWKAAKKSSSGALEPTPVPRPIPDDLLPILIRLCHPDRHANSEASNRATAWLLSQRGRP